MLSKKKNPLFVWGWDRKIRPSWSLFVHLWDRFFFPILTNMIDSYITVLTGMMRNGKIVLYWSYRWSTVYYQCFLLSLGKARWVVIFHALFWADIQHKMQVCMCIQYACAYSNMHTAKSQVTLCIHTVWSDFLVYKKKHWDPRYP